MQTTLCCSVHVELSAGNRCSTREVNKSCDLDLEGSYDLWANRSKWLKIEPTGQVEQNFPVDRQESDNSYLSSLVIF